MANFEKKGQSIHGTTQAITEGQEFAFGLWGPWYKSNPNSEVWDLELDVTITGSPVGSTLTKGAVTSSPPVRAYKAAGLPQGMHTFVAKDRGGSVNTTFVLNVKPPPGKRITAAQLTTKEGTMGWTGWSGACAPVQGLARQLESATGGVLSAGNVRLQGAGHGSTIDEHYAGLSLDIKLDARTTPPAGTTSQKQQAHNLIRFFVANRVRMGWLQMFYEMWGFGQRGPINPEKNHHDHIHIDWFDLSLADPPGFENRASWTAITWPEAAMRPVPDLTEDAHRMELGHASIHCHS